MLNVVLYRPEIPPNTGNLIRLCANSGAALHLIEPLGFSMEAKALRRAGLDYREAARVRRWPSLDACLDDLGTEPFATAASPPPAPGYATSASSVPQALVPRSAERRSSGQEAATRVFAATTRGRTRHTVPRYREGDVLLFGPESRGLPDTVLDDRRITELLRVPMLPGSRSLNLSNAVSIVLYEAWRQLDFAGAAS